MDQNPRIGPTFMIRIQIINVFGSPLIATDLTNLIGTVLAGHLWDVLLHPGLDAGGLSGSAKETKDNRPKLDTNTDPDPKHWTKLRGKN